MKDSQRDLIRLYHILDAIYEIESYLQEIEESDFERNNMVQSACIRQLEIIGEAANKMSDSMKVANPSIEWRELIGLRNILIHEYFDGCFKN